MNKKFIYEYLSKREAVLPKEEQESLRTEIFELKKKAAANLPELVKSAKANLEKNGARVFVVKDKAEAAKKIAELAGSAKIIAKAKSNTLDKLGLNELFGDRLAETDLGAYIVSIIGQDSDHPILPSIDLTAKEIAAALKAKTSREYPSEAEALVDVLKREIREKILSAEVGLTGANAVTADGQIMLMENEGNISLITLLPKLHIAVCGVEKVVADYVDAVKIAKAAAVWGTGQSWPSYVSFIGGPSKTADIENELVTGVQGAQELNLILIEGEVYDKIGTELESMLYCIHCGACYNLCATWGVSGLMPKAVDAKSAYDCTLCQNCSFNCPAKIDWNNLARICRARYNKDGNNTANNIKMIEQIRAHGNPFGDKSGDKVPTELFCC